MVENSFHQIRAQVSLHLSLGACAVIALAPACAFAATPTDTSRRELVVASIAFNFARFVQWRESDAESASGNLVFCVLDDSPSPAWREIEGKSVGQRKIELEYVGAAAPFGRNCDMAYVSENSMEGLSVRDLAESGVVTISDVKRFTKEGGAIGLDISDRGATFDINEKSLNRAGARISSKLLRVGMRVSLSGN